MEKSLEWLEPYTRGNYQFFREWATAAWRHSGGKVIPDFALPWKMKMLLGKLGLVFALPGRRKKKLIICTGGRPDYMAWPWCYFYELVPIIWDCWPKYRESMLRFIAKNRVRTVFCTARRTCEVIRERYPKVNAVWLPEGIDVSLYPMGSRLVDRPNAVMEFGRDAGGKLRYPTHEEFTQALRDSKIVICRPRCDTHPDEAGDVETMTQRYWEAMLSGAVIVGRAPRELVDFCGYNPVVEDETPEQVLGHIGNFQELVERNRRFAESNASWNVRMSIIQKVLEVS